MHEIGQFFEIAMIIAFGCSWPNNIITTLRNKSAKGKSLLFLILIDFGYVCGITGKILIGNIVWYVMLFYVLNFIMVTTDMILYFHFRRLDKIKDQEA